eukprot:g4596.t1
MSRDRYFAMLEPQESAQKGNAKMGVLCSKQGIEGGAEQVANKSSLPTPGQAASGTNMNQGQAPAAISWELLAKQSSETSNAIIQSLQGNPEFEKVSIKETEGIKQRDAEDGDKLQEGIELAIGKGVLDKDVKVEPVTKVDVMGKSATQVADEIIAGLGEAAKTGCVMVLQGLSGTGKGTTVEALKAKLPNAKTWSNGNVFRCLTLLATTWAEQEKKSLEEALTPENLKTFLGMLSFDKHDGKEFDVKVEGLGITALVKDIQNTSLKAASVGSNIPSVARVTQGEVILFVRGALQKMADDGASVLVEGREQTLNYIRTPYRFELVLSDENIIGRYVQKHPPTQAQRDSPLDIKSGRRALNCPSDRRRAAQRMGASAFKALGGKVQSALEAALAELVKEAGGSDQKTQAGMSWDLLNKYGPDACRLQQNSETSAAVIDMFKGNSDFEAVSVKETAGIKQRDAEDGDKLQEGIVLAIEKGVLEKDVKVEPVTKVPVLLCCVCLYNVRCGRCFYRARVLQVDVMGKAATKVADEIIAGLGEAAKTGCVMVLQGLSGTGKGTTVEVICVLALLYKCSKTDGLTCLTCLTCRSPTARRPILHGTPGSVCCNCVLTWARAMRVSQALKAKLPNAKTWSNGNVFRCLTLLATTWAEQEKKSLEEALTPENLKTFLGMLSFDKHDGKEFDVKVEGLGITALVKDIQNTSLKAASVGSNIPSVARVTQGEVILFVRGALQKMADDGASVLVEGREQTLNYIRTPYRFELVLSDENIIGRRRAAQRMGGAAHKALSGKGESERTTTAVKSALDEALAELMKEK